MSDYLFDLQDRFKNLGFELVSYNALPLKNSSVLNKNTIIFRRNQNDLTTHFAECVYLAESKRYSVSATVYALSATRRLKHYLQTADMSFLPSFWELGEGLFSYSFNPPQIGRQKNLVSGKSNAKADVEIFDGIRENLVLPILEIDTGEKISSLLQNAWPGLKLSADNLFQSTTHLLALFSSDADKFSKCDEILNRFLESIKAQGVDQETGVEFRVFFQNLIDFPI